MRANGSRLRATHRAGEGVRDHERRGREVVCSGQGMHAALEVPVPRQHGRSNDVCKCMVAMRKGGGKG